MALIRSAPPGGRPALTRAADTPLTPPAQHTMAQRDQRLVDQPAAAKRTKRRFGPSLIPALALTAFLALPLLGLLARAVGAGGIWDALGRPIVLAALRLSLLTSALVLLLALLLGSPLALLLARQRFRGIGVLDSLVDLPIVLPPAGAGLAPLLCVRRGRLLGAPPGAARISPPLSTGAGCAA